jgi:hypothetical protein
MQCNVAVEHLQDINLWGCGRQYLVLACGGSYARLCSSCFASLLLAVRSMLDGAHFVFSGVLD